MTIVILRRITCVALLAGILVGCDVASSTPKPAPTTATQPGPVMTSQPAQTPSGSYPAPAQGSGYPAPAAATAYPAP